MLQLFTRVRGAFSAPLPLLGLVAAVGPLAMATGSGAATLAPADPAEAAYHSLPALPEGSSERGVDGVVATAIELASTLNAVATNDEGDTCAPDLLYVSWDTPDDVDYQHGAHLTPVGPAPTEETTKVNGVVLCETSDFAYMGFEARWSATDDRWDVVAVPDITDESHEHLVEEPAPEMPVGPKPVPVLAAPGTVDGPIEGYAAYEPQRTCDGSPKAGTRSLAGALLRDYPGSRNLGIVRGCSVGGRSEHKEGRAFDWGVNIGNAGEKAAAESFIGALMATDKDGNKHALARRMGVMYVIWDRQIWSSYRASDGWRPYSGASAHRDHVHISMSWAGAEGRTSFWSGTVPPDLPTATPGRSAGTVASGRSRSRIGSAAPVVQGSGREQRGGGGDRNGRRDAWNAARALWEDGTPPTQEELQSTLVANGMSPEQAAEAVSWWLERNRDDRDRNDDGDGNGDRGGDDAERAAREAARREEEARRRAAWEERAQAEGDRRREREEARRAEEERRREEWEEAREEAEEAREVAQEEWEERQQAWREREEARRAAEQAERERRAAERAAAEQAWRAERERRRLEEEARRRGATTTTTPPAPTTTTAPPAPTTTTTAAPAPTTTTAPPATTSTSTP